MEIALGILLLVAIAFVVLVVVLPPIMLLGILLIERLWGGLMNWSIDKSIEYEKRQRSRQ